MSQVLPNGSSWKASGDKAVGRMVGLSRDQLREQEKTKRFLILSVTILVVAAAVAMVFAPAGREKFGEAIGAVLLILALGAVGASKFLIRLPGVVVDTRSPIKSEKESEDQQSSTGLKLALENWLRQHAYKSVPVPLSHTDSQDSPNSSTVRPSIEVEDGVAHVAVTVSARPVPSAVYLDVIGKSNTNWA